MVKSKWPVMLGAHESTAGGIHKAFERIRAVGGEALQIFTRNQRQWNAPPLTEKEINDFRVEWELSAKMPVASHASYLINLGTSDKVKSERSISALSAELNRCGQLGIPYVVLHPGSHGGAGEETGLASVAKALDAAFAGAGAGAGDVMVLLETTAGQGTGLGSSFGELAWIMGNSACGERLGVCVDTCHIFAAGYDIRTAGAYKETMAALDEAVGLKNVRFIHLNDSKKDFGSRVDRHEHIGRGCIGIEGFRLLLNDKNLQHIPMTLETPKEKDLHEDRENLRRLRELFPTE